MNENNLSKRLTLVAENIPQGSKLADIGSDHAYLPCYAFKQGIINSAIAGEINDGPFQSALEQVKKLNLESVITVRKGNGLEVVERGEVDCITIAGMGGPLIASILESGKEKLPGVQRLILQPNVAANQVRNWLEENNWVLTGESIIEEDGVIYEVMTADHKGACPYSKEKRDIELLMGPFLLKEKNKIFQKKWRDELKTWKQILKQLEKAKASKDLEERKEKLIERITFVEGELGNETSERTNDYSSI